MALPSLVSRRTKTSLFLCAAFARRPVILLETIRPELPAAVEKPDACACRTNVVVKLQAVPFAGLRLRAVCNASVASCCAARDPQHAHLKDGARLRRRFS